MTRIARTSAVAGTALVATLSVAGPASAAPLAIERYVEVANCTQPTGQVCPEVPSITEHFATTRVRVSFTASNKHCSKMIARVMIDGYEWGFRVVGPGQNDGGHIVPIGHPGVHTIGIKGEGIPGGCNTGKLASWAGSLRVEEMPQ